MTEARPASPRRCLLVGNPTAQSGRNAIRIEDARRLLSRGCEHEFLPTLPGGAAVEEIGLALSTGRFDTVIAMGGDGTFADAAKGLLRSGQPESLRLGMLPAGTANDQGKSFGLSADDIELPRNVEVILEGHETRLDVGQIKVYGPEGGVLRQDEFFDSAGWGISPRILAVRNDDKKLLESVPILGTIYRDHAVYAGAVLRTFMTSYLEPEQFAVTARIDGSEYRWDKLCDLVVKGTRIYGGIWVLAPGSRHDDGKFEVIPFTGKRDWLSKAVAHLDHSGKLAERLEYFGVGPSPSTAGSKIELEFHLWPGAKPLAAQIDGEEFVATTRVDIDVMPRALRLIVPRTNPQSAPAPGKRNS